MDWNGDGTVSQQEMLEAVYAVRVVREQDGNRTCSTSSGGAATKPFRVDCRTEFGKAESRRPRVLGGGATEAAGQPAAAPEVQPSEVSCRRTVSLPPSRWTIRTGNGTPAATQATVILLPPDWTTRVVSSVRPAMVRVSRPDTL